MVNLISESYSILYFANKCSGAFLFCVFVYFIMIILPLLIGFTTRDFWILESTYQQQPRIEPNDEYIIKVLLSDQTTLSFTNIPEIQALISNSQCGLSFSLLSQSEYGSSQTFPRASNFTGNIYLTLPSTTLVSSIREIQILTFYTYILDDIVSMRMQAYAYANLVSSHGIQSATVVGQLQLKQRHPLEAGTVARTTFNYSSYYSQLGAILPEPNQILDINYKERNESIFYNYRTIIVNPIEDSNQVNIQMIMQVPKYQRVLYQASILESLKYSWMQYFSIFLICWFLGQHLLEYVAVNKVFSTFQMNNIPKLAPSYTKLKRD